MSMSFVQGDTAPDITAIIHLEDDPEVALDLTGCTIRFQMRKQEDRRYQVNAAASIVDAELGSVAYAWSNNDLSVPGDYLAQFEITYSTGRVQTTQPPVDLTVSRQ